MRLIFDDRVDVLSTTTVRILQLKFTLYSAMLRHRGVVEVSCTLYLTAARQEWVANATCRPL